MSISLDPTPLDLTDDADAWATAFFERMLARRLVGSDFETVAQQRWDAGRFIARAPKCASWLKALALNQHVDAGYGSTLKADFRSSWLVGTPGWPGAIHIQAPPELQDSALLTHKNRPPHQHDGARISLITEGEATLFVQRDDRFGVSRRLECPVKSGDLIFWPAWTTHTFDAGRGFSLISAMSNYVSPAADGFALQPPAVSPALDALKPLSYAQHLEQL